MNDSIRLTRIHALNWYGYQDSIPVQGNLLFAGITGSGKSILMDLIQFVLVGNQRLLRFNKSATGEGSHRTLKGYCLGDTKEEESGVTQYMRNSAITFVALEFTWPLLERVETWGFRVEFASAAEMQGRVTPFFVPAALSRVDFLDEEKRPLDHAAFKVTAESHVDAAGVRGRVYAELSEYLTHMAQPTHLNFDRSVLQALLPTAMSFTFLDSFNDFCRQFILPADKLDITDVTSSYRTFQRYEQDLKGLNDQLERLRKISELFVRHGGLLRDTRVARYLWAELSHDHARDLRLEAEQRLRDLRTECNEEQTRLAQLEMLIPQRRSDLEGIKNAIRGAPDGPLYLDLKNRNHVLADQIGRLRETARALESALAGVVSGTRVAEQRALEQFERVRAEADISAWLARLAELREDVCTRLFAKDSAAKEFESVYHLSDKEAVGCWEQLRAARHELMREYTRFDDLPIDAPDNSVYDKHLGKLVDSDIPDYKSKAERERKSWERLFRTQVLEKLRNALFDVENTRILLNGCLKRPIGNNRYRIVKWENPDFGVYHKMLDASALAHEGELFFTVADADLREACDRFLQILIDEDKKAEATRLLDYRHYFEYDMEVEAFGNDGELQSTTRVDRQSGKFSGGENQSPYFIAILASYLRAYKRYDTRKGHPSIALVPIDEAFSKLSGDFIKDCIEALKSLDLQGVFSMSSGNIPYAFEHCDSLVVVAKEQRRVDKRLQIRNVPVSLHKESLEARQVLGIEP